MTDPQYVDLVKLVSKLDGKLDGALQMFKQQENRLDKQDKKLEAQDEKINRLKGRIDWAMGAGAVILFILEGVREFLIKH